MFCMFLQNKIAKKLNLITIFRYIMLNFFVSINPPNKFYDTSSCKLTL